MYIEYEKGNSHYRFNFDNILNLIIGDSSTGKTDFVKKIIKNRKYVKTDATRLYINPIGVDFNTAESGSIVIVDSDDVLLEDIKGISKLTRTDVTFVIFGRKYAKSFPFAVCNTFEIKKQDKVKVNVQMYQHNKYVYGEFNEVRTEDSKSGKIFFSNIFDNTKTTNGNGNINKYIKSDILLVIDSVGFGGYIEEFLVKANNAKSPYILYNSFESFILQEKFKDDYMPIAINIEDALVNRLRSYIPSYSKSIGCTGKACKNCKSMCAMSSRELLEKSKYSNLLRLYNKSIDSDDTESIFTEYINKYNLNRETDWNSEYDRLSELCKSKDKTKIALYIKNYLL